MRNSNRLSRILAVMLLIIASINSKTLVPSASSSQSSDESLVHESVKRFFDLYQQGDLEKLLSMWSEKSPYLAENKADLQKALAENQRVVPKNFSILRVKIESDQAIVRITLGTSRFNVNEPALKIDVTNQTLRLAKEQSVWKIHSYLSSEEDLAMAIGEARTEQDRIALMTQEPELYSVELGKALLKQGHSLYYDKELYHEAIALCQLACNIGEEFEDKRLMAEALRKMAVVYAWSDNPGHNPELALQILKQVNAIAEENNYKDIIAAVLTNFALIYHQQQNFRQAQEYYHRSLRAPENAGDKERTAQVLNNLGVIYLHQNNYPKALECLYRSLALAEEGVRKKVNNAEVAVSYTLESIGNVYYLQGDYAQAKEHYQRSLQLATKAGSKGDIALALSDIGDVYMQEGEYSLATETFERSLALSRGLNSGDLGEKNTFPIFSALKLGNAYEAQKAHVRAHSYYRDALKWAETSRLKREMAFALSHLSRNSISLGNFEQAIEFANRALVIAEQNEFLKVTLDAFCTLGKAYLTTERPSQAYEALNNAIAASEKLRDQTAGGEIDRQRHFENALSPYQGMIDLQVKQARPEKAFEYTQLAKGRSLLDILRYGRSNISKAMTVEEQEQEQRLNSRLVSVNAAITAEKLKSPPDKGRLAELEDRLRKERLEVEAFRTTLYTIHPELKAQRGEFQPLSPSELDELVPDSKTALLDFMITDEATYLFVLTRDRAPSSPLSTGDRHYRFSSGVELNLYPLDIKRKELADLTSRFRQRLANKDFGFHSLAEDLYRLLLKPARKQLQDKTSLVIVPDGPLWELPFQVLRSPQKRFLVEDVAISYAPSLPVLREIQKARNRKQPPGSTLLLALGNPSLGKETVRLVKQVFMDEELHPLPEAGRQARALRNLYGNTRSKIYVGTEAREARVKEEASKYRVLHLATHGILNDSSPMYSHVMLSQTRVDGDEDGLLEAWEIMNLDLNADLTVLSACETARGRVSPGEGVIGLSWALFVAGCPTAVVSQWKVESSSTTELMLEFHDRYRKKYFSPQTATTTAEALRQASIKLMQNKRFRHPFYWAGFVVIGDGR